MREPLDLLLELIALGPASFASSAIVLASRSHAAADGRRLGVAFAPATSFAQLVRHLAPPRLGQFHLVRAAVAELLQERRRGRSCPPARSRIALARSASGRRMRTEAEFADRDARPLLAELRLQHLEQRAPREVREHRRLQALAGEVDQRPSHPRLELADERRRVELRPVLCERRLRGGDERRDDLRREPRRRTSPACFCVALISRLELAASCPAARRRRAGNRGRRAG